MNITYKDNTVNVEILTAAINKGAPFETDRSKIDWSNTKSTDKYNKINANKLHISIPFAVLEEMSKLWDNQFNVFSSFEERKAILNLMSLSELISSNAQNPYKVSDVENELKSTYNSFSKKNIEIDITDAELFNCDYYLLFKPLSAYLVDIEFVPVDKFNNAKEESLSKYFYFAVKVPLSNLQDGIDDKDADKKIPVALSLDSFELPISKTTITYSDYILADIKAYFLTGRITPQGTNPNEVFFDYESLSKFILNTSNESYFYKTWGAKSLMCLTEVLDKKLNPHGDGFFVKLKKHFIYSGIFFPIFFKLKTNSFLAYYACEDSKKRSRYGFFSKDYLGDNLSKDEPLFEDFDSFFVYDFIEDLKNPIIAKGELSINDFSDS